MSTRVSCELTEDFLQKIFIPLVCRLKRVLVGHWSAWSSRLSSANGRSADVLTATRVSQMLSPREELTPGEILLVVPWICLGCDEGARENS